MIVLNFLGTRLIDVAELQAVAWCNNKTGKGKVPIDNNNWTYKVPEENWFWCVTAFEKMFVPRTPDLNVNRRDNDKTERVQISRMFKTWTEAKNSLIAFSAKQPIEIDFFYKEWLAMKEQEKNSQKDFVKPLMKVKQNTLIDFPDGVPKKNIKDAVVTVE